ncbi:homing endonuclease associated repeat-containing protein [Mycobacteroides abscessus]|uniref:homing endonuclease associated repeat-containing protein n=1 Tax=Mycobacteroides abscessus TaxID=36809 RepID=UPI000C25CF4E|nr:MucR family transcriptional regulator [Mycobacteroides abscessus]
MSDYGFTERQQVLMRHYLKKGIVLDRDTKPELEPYKEPLRKVEYGYGYMGVVAHNEAGTHVQCHLCGYFFADVAKHLKQHGISSTEYRQKFDLNRQSKLASKQSRQRYIDASLNVSSDEKLRRVTMFKSSVMSKRMAYGHKRSLEWYNERGICPDQILDKIEKLAVELKRTPTRRDWEQMYGSASYIYKTFGSWNQALSFAGLTPNAYRPSRPRYTRESVIAMIRNFYELEGRVPRSSDLGVMLPSSKAIGRLFGGLVEARAAAGFGQHDYLNETAETDI